MVFDDVIIDEKEDTEHDSIQFWILLVRAMFTLLRFSSEYPRLCMLAKWSLRRA